MAESVCAEKRGGLSEEAHAVEPLLVERKGSEAVRARSSRLSLASVDRSSLRVEMSEGAAEDRAGGVLDNEVADRRLDLVQTSPEVAQRVALQPVGGDCPAWLRTLTDGKRSRNQLFGFREPARPEGDHRLRGANEPELCGLPQPVGDSTGCFEFVRGLAHLPDHEVHHEPLDVAVHELLAYRRSARSRREARC